MIAMCRSDNQGEAIRNRTSLSTLALTVDSTAVQPTGYLKVNLPNVDQIAYHLVVR